MEFIKFIGQDAGYVVGLLFVIAALTLGISIIIFWTGDAIAKVRRAGKR
jgi:hypothetical protein